MRRLKEGSMAGRTVPERTYRHELVRIRALILALFLAFCFASNGALTPFLQNYSKAFPVNVLRETGSPESHLSSRPACFPEITRSDENRFSSSSVYASFRQRSAESGDRRQSGYSGIFPQPFAVLFGMPPAFRTACFGKYGRPLRSSLSDLIALIHAKDGKKRAL